MGRPLNKKYFGNRNIGTGGDQTIGTLSNSQNYADDRIGGEGIASINWSNFGSWLSATSGSAPLAGLTLPAPTLPDGVQATWTNYFGASTVTTGAGSVGLVVGETYEYAASPGLLVTVLTSTNNATNATFAVTTAGSTTTLLQDLTGVTLTLVSNPSYIGVGTFLVDIKLKIVNTVIGEKGSGYTGAETITVTLVNGASGTAPVGTIVKTTENGIVGTTGNQENAIRMIGFLTGGSAAEVDIIRQVSTNRYKVTDGTRTGIVQLQTTLANAAGEGSIAATDSAGGQYFVTKLTARKATVTRAGGSGWLYATNQAAPWKFDAPAGIYLQIANA